MVKASGRLNLRGVFCFDGFVRGDDSAHGWGREKETVGVGGTGLVAGIPCQLVVVVIQEVRVEPPSPPEPDLSGRRWSALQTELPQGRRESARRPERQASKGIDQFGCQILGMMTKTAAKGVGGRPENRRSGEA